MLGTEFQIIIFVSLVISFVIGWSFGYFIDRRYLKHNKLKKDVLKEYMTIKSERDALVKELVETKERFLKTEIQLNEEIKIVKDGLRLLRKKKLNIP
tara:strand:+ start:1905 stop:2195 length:291 start_codon:yes stop_codon:yes gene_type:complete